VGAFLMESHYSSTIRELPDLALQIVVNLVAPYRVKFDKDGLYYHFETINHSKTISSHASAMRSGTIGYLRPLYPPCMHAVNAAAEP